MRVLAYDVTDSAGAVALADATGWRRWLGFPAGRRAGPALLPAIHAVLTEEGWPLESLDALALVPGPGSFTGGRIAVAVAKGLALGRELAGQTPLRLAAIPGGLLRAAMMFDASPAIQRAAVVHALSKRAVHLEVFERGQQARTESVIDDPGVIAARLDAEPIVWCGALDRPGGWVPCDATGHPVTRAAAAFERWHAAFGTTVDALAPLYSRDAYVMG